MPKYKATAYIRLSYTDDRSSESDSVSNQRKLIENFIMHNPDIQIVSEKIDDGYSGIIFDRPAFKEMMHLALVESILKLVDICVVYSLLMEYALYL